MLHVTTPRVNDLNLFTLSTTQSAPLVPHDKNSFFFVFIQEDNYFLFIRLALAIIQLESVKTNSVIPFKDVSCQFSAPRPDLFTDKLVNLINIVIFNKYSIFETLPDWFSPLLIVVRVWDNCMIITGYLLIQQCLTMTISDFCCNNSQFLDSSLLGLLEVERRGKHIFREKWLSILLTMTQMKTFNGHDHPLKMVSC